jgi:hypothetical protein
MTKHTPEMSQAAADVLAERFRQVEGEGWASPHDDQHTGGELALAAACYAISGGTPQVDRGRNDNLLAAIQFVWPRSWAWAWWKPKARRHDLVRAGALIIAEIERIDRAKTPE